MQPFSAEHIEPRSKRGETRFDNLAWACQGCNNHKYNRSWGRDPLTGAKVVLFHRRRHEWSEHFAWNEDCTLILGQTSIGRATVEALHLNRSGLINLRRILFLVQEHPPKKIDA